jgi:hypothetical protein
MQNRSDEAARWRAKAEECRNIAATLTDPEAKATFQQMAESYERRAELREWVKPGAPEDKPAVEPKRG